MTAVITLASCGDPDRRTRHPTFAFRVRIGARRTARAVAGGLARRSRSRPADIASVRAIDVDPFAEFGGWGLRYGLDGRYGVVLRRGEALEVTRVGGRRFVVTVDDAQTAAAALAAVHEEGSVNSMDSPTPTSRRVEWPAIIVFVVVRLRAGPGWWHCHCGSETVSPSRCPSSSSGHDVHSGHRGTGRHLRDERARAGTACALPGPLAATAPPSAWSGSWSPHGSSRRSWWRSRSWCPQRSGSCSSI